MLGLLYKEFRVNRPMIIALVCLSFFFNMTVFFGDFRGEAGADLVTKLVGFLMYGSAFFTVAFCSMATVQNDERNKWGYYVTSLPGGVVKQTASKYLLTLISVAFVFLVCFIQSAISMKESGGESGSFKDVIGMLALFAGGALIFVAIELPFTFAFGAKAGAYVKCAIFLAAILGALIYFMFGDISWLGSADDAAAKAFDRIVGFDYVGAAKKVFAFAVPLYLLSFFISSKVYLFGVERMEK